MPRPLTTAIPSLQAPGYQKRAPPGILCLLSEGCKPCNRQYLAPEPSLALTDDREMVPRSANPVSFSSTPPPPPLATISVGSAGMQLGGVTEKLNGVTDRGRQKLNGVTDGAPEKGRHIGKIWYPFNGLNGWWLTQLARS